MNTTILTGNFTRDIDFKYAQSGTAIASTAIAVSHKYTQNGEKKEDVMFIDVTFFGKSAEIVNQYCHKGSKMLVEGRLNLDQWVDQNGGKRSKHTLIVARFEMLDSKPADNQGGAQQPNQGNQNYQQQGQQQQQQQPNQGNQNYQQQGQQQQQQQPNQGNQNYQQQGQQQQQQQNQGNQNYQQQGQQNQGGNNGYQQPNNAQSNQQNVPQIDIDEDEIPF